MRVREDVKPASTNSRRAMRWYPASTSIVVSTPSERMPRSSQSPLTPVPVPISTTERAPPAAASKRSVAPAAGATGARPTSAASPRAARSTRSSGV